MINKLILQRLFKSVKSTLLRSPILQQVIKSFLLCEHQLDAMIHPSSMLYYCPCCNSKLRSFVSGNYYSRSYFFNPERYYGIQQEVKCPICGSIPRHRILALWFSKHKEEIQNKSILYFACEPGIKMWLERNHIKAITADLFAHADLKLDLCNINQPDNSWDWIVCNHVLEHVDNYQTALHELYRVLKPGGTLIISFPIQSSLPTVIEETVHTKENIKKRLQLYGQADHLRVFGKDSKNILRAVGFKVFVISGCKMDKRIMPVVGPADYDVNYLFLCKKPKFDAS